MKKLLSLFAAAMLTASISQATSFTLNGTAINNAPGLNDIDDVTVWVINSGGSAFDSSSFGSLPAGISFTDGGSINGYEIAVSSSIIGADESRFVFGPGTIEVTANPGNAFGALVFDSSTNETAAGDSYSVFSDSSWVLPASGATITFGATDQPNTLSADGFTSTVVPEPSTYAVLAGLCALSFVIVRRRR